MISPSNWTETPVFSQCVLCVSQLMRVTTGFFCSTLYAFMNVIDKELAAGPVC